MIQNKVIFKILNTFVISACMISMGCSTAKKTEEPLIIPEMTTHPIVDENVSLGDSDSERAFGLQTIHFPYDSSLLNSVEKNILQANASILKAHSQMKIQIEGHCDARGGIQYNIALGEKRADATRKYLEDLGIAVERIAIVSFGKEKPIDLNTTEAAYTRNRRANFVVTTH